jgi:hypothetical protein
MRHARLSDPVAHPVQEPRAGHATAGAAGRGGDRAGRDRHPEQVARGLRGALLGQELPDRQVAQDRGAPRPVPHRRVHPGRCPPAGRHAAAAAPPDQLMLHHPHRRLRDVDHPTTHHLGLRRAGTAQIATTSATRGRLMAPHLVRGLDPLQGAARMPRLSTRLAPRPCPPRLAPAGHWTVAGRSSSSSAPAAPPARSPARPASRCPTAAAQSAQPTAHTRQHRARTPTTIPASAAMARTDTTKLRNQDLTSYPQTRSANSICSRGCTMPSEQQCSMTMEV